MDEEPLPTILQTSSLDPVGRANPHPRLDALRARCPVLPDAIGGGYFLTKHHDVRSILSNLALWRDPHKANPDTARALRILQRPPPRESLDEGNPPCSIIFLDDPDHSRIRGPIALVLNYRIKQMRRGIEAIVERQLDRVEHSETFDVISEYAELIPIQVIAAIIGVDSDQGSQFRKWSKDLLLFMKAVRSSAETQRLIEAQNAAHRYFLGLLASRRAEPRDDLISDIVALQAKGVPITDHEIQSNLRVLITAGNLTTTDMIGNTIWLLLSHPAARLQLQSGAIAAAAVVEEALRMEPPVDVTFRIAPQNLEIGGQSVTSKQVLTLSLRAANRDPEAYTQPHRFDPGRTGKPHVSFGGGAHICLGAALARMEIQIAVEGLFRRLPNLQLAAPSSPPTWRALAPFRGLEKLEVRP